MSRVAAPFLTRVTARTLSTATGSAQKVDQAALDAAARSAGMKIEKFTATQAITKADFQFLLTSAVNLARGSVAPKSPLFARN